MPALLAGGQNTSAKLSASLSKGLAVAVDVSKDVEDAAGFQRLADAVEKGMGNGKAVLLAASLEGKVTLLALVSQDLVKVSPAGALVQAAAVAVDGKGGGKPNRAQAGGKDVDKIPAALEAFLEAAKAKLA